MATFFFALRRITSASSRGMLGMLLPNVTCFSFFFFFFFFQDEGRFRLRARRRGEKEKRLPLLRALYKLTKKN